MAGATEVWRFAVTCPIGVDATAPQITNIKMPSRSVLGIRVRVPPGPNGAMGWALGSAGVRVIPAGPVTFIVAADEIFELVLKEQIDSGSWQAQMYNTGSFPHSIYIDFTVEVPDPDVDLNQSIIITPSEIASAATPAVAPVITETITPLPELT